MKVAALAFALAISASLCFAARDKGGIGPKTDFRNLTAEEALGLLERAETIKIDAKGEWADTCNGKNSDGNPGEMECIRSLGQFEQDYSSPGNLLQLFKGLIRACGIYAPTPGQTWGGDRSGASCGLLGSLFFAVGNVPAARAIWEHAPGCHSHDINGNPTNGCMRFVLTGGHSLGAKFPFLEVPGRYTLYDSDPTQLRAMAEDACSKETDEPSCKYLKRQGSQIDMQAVRDEQHNRATAELATVKEQQDAHEEQVRQADASTNAAIQTLQGMAGPYNPNAIVESASGAPAAPGATPSNLSAQSSRAAAIRQGTSAGGSGDGSSRGANSGAHPTNQGSGTTGSSADSAAVYANALSASCVSSFRDPKYYNWLSFQNNCGQAIYLSYIFNSGQGGFSAMNLAAGASGNTGRSQNEVKAQGGYELAVCPAEFVPVDSSTGNALSQPKQQFRCRKR